MIRIDDLEIKNYKIYQDTDKFCFGIDAVLLANFILMEENKNFCLFDLCTGNGIIPFIIYAKRKSHIKIDAIDIDCEQIQLAKKTIDLNKHIDKNIDDDLHFINDDIKNIINTKKYVDYINKYDVVSCNPPYIKKNSGIENLSSKLNFAKHEIYITLDIICKTANTLLNANKNFYMIHRTDRLAEIIRVLKENNLEPKKIQFVYPSINKKSNLFLIKSTKKAKEGIIVKEPIIVFDNKGNFTDYVLNIYGK